MPDENQLEIELRKNTEELKRYVLEIMELSPPMALTVLFDVASQILTEKFPRGYHVLMLEIAYLNILTDINGAKGKAR